MIYLVENILLFKPKNYGRNILVALYIPSCLSPEISEYIMVNHQKTITQQKPSSYNAPLSIDAIKTGCAKEATLLQQPSLQSRLRAELTSQYTPKRFS